MTAPASMLANDLRFPAPIANIVADVAYQMGLRRADIIGPGRTKPLVRARAAVVWLARELVEASFGMIGGALGDRHHSVIATSYGKAAALRQRDPAFKRLTERLLDHYRNLQED